MQCRLTEIASDVYRLSSFHPGFGIQFNQFLVKDDEPFLMHTGFRSMFGTTLEGVRALIDPGRLRWIGFSHFESDECGALNDWLELAPNAQPLCGVVGAMVNLGDFAVREARALEDDEVVHIGSHRLRYLSTPHVPHGWDAGLFFDEGERTLFCSDLFFQPGDPEPISGSEIVDHARDSIQRGLAGPLAHDMPYTPYTDTTLQRLAALQPGALAVMHGASFQGDGREAILDLAAVVRELLGGQGGRAEG